MKCQMLNVIKCQESWNVKCHEMSNVVKCQISRNADADAGYMTKRWYLSQSSQAALV